MPSLNVDLLNAALSAITETHQFVSEKEFRKQTSHEQVNLNSINQFNLGGDDANSIIKRSILPAPVSSTVDETSTYQQVDLDSFHQLSLVGGDVGSIIKNVTNSPEIKELIQLFVSTLTGKVLTVQCQKSDTVDKVKELIQNKEGLPPDKQRLIFVGKQMADDCTLADYDVQNGSKLHMVLRMPGGGDDGISMLYRGEDGNGRVISYLPSNVLDPKYNYDFTHVKDVGETYMRGKVQYQRPCGWQRFALKVSGKYDNGDDSWLGTGDDAWPVSYHGTAKYNAKSISEEGYLLSKGKRFAFGRGIYSTPDVCVAELYAKEFEFSGKTYVIVIQNRVNPKNLVKIEATKTRVGEYWISKDGQDVRPYGICIKEKFNNNGVCLLQ